LCLENVLVEEEVVQLASTALACLPALRELTLIGYTPVGLASQVTGLTKLFLCGWQYIEPMWKYEKDGWLAAAIHNPGLQSLNMGLDRDMEVRHELTAAALTQLRNACPGITSLDLMESSIDQEGLDVLLALGTAITHLGLRSIAATQDRSGAVCQWIKLELSPQHSYRSIQTSAYLPLSTVQVLKPSVLMRDLLLPLDTVPPAQLPQLLHKAATKLAACPA
jgi:hypothetical protein